VKLFAAILTAEVSLLRIRRIRRFRNRTRAIPASLPAD
jgi:hypothetical protein